MAAASGHLLTRINLSETTDMMDLLGADLPDADGGAGAFKWWGRERGFVEGDVGRGKLGSSTDWGRWRHTAISMVVASPVHRQCNCCHSFPTHIVTNAIVGSAIIASVIKTYTIIKIIIVVYLPTNSPPS